MHLVRHSDLRINIAVNLTVLKPYVKKLTGLTTQSQEELIDAIMRAMSGYVILAPDAPLNSYERGQFGVTEPHPFPDLVDENGVPKLPGSR